MARAVVYDVVVSGGVSDGGCADGGCTDGGCAEGGCTDSGCADGGCMDGGCAVAGEGGAIVAWQYAGKANTSATGSFRILPDGSSIIGWGIRGLPNPTFTELDSQGNAVLEFSFTDGNSTYRAIKVPLSAFDLNVLRTSTGMP